MMAHIYHGLPQCISLKIGEEKALKGAKKSKFKDFEFAPGKVIKDLPEENPIIAQMIATEVLIKSPPEPVKQKETK